MSSELFSGILLAILAVVIVANITRNKTRRNKQFDNSSARADAQKIIDSYIGDDSDSRFARELDLIPLKILSDEFGMASKRQRKK